MEPTEEGEDIRPEDNDDDRDPSVNYSEMNYLIIRLHDECLIEDQNPKVPYPVCINQAKCVHIINDALRINYCIDTKEMLFYRKGVYKPNADILLQKALAHAFLDLTNKGMRPIYTTTIRNEITNRLRELSAGTLDSKFDSDLDIINMTNGLYNWRTNEFKPHDPKYPSRIQIPVMYNPDARCPNIMTFLQKILSPEDYQKVLEFIGYLLYRGYPIQKIFILLGPGGTGKSTLLGIMRGFVGEENAEAITPQELVSDRFASADLKNKLLNAPGDIGNNKLEQTSVIKMLTGNKDKSRSQKKYQNSFTFQNFAKQIFGLNKLLETSDNTSGWYRRAEIVSTEYVLAQDEFTKEFLDSLTSEEELSGLFNLVIPLLAPLLERNAFTNQTSVEDSEWNYEAASATERVFCDKYLINVIGYHSRKDAVYNLYLTLCKESNAKPLSANQFSRFVHKYVAFCPTPRNTNDEKASFGGQSYPAWRDTTIDFVEWNKRKSVLTKSEGDITEAEYIKAGMIDDGKPKPEIKK